MARERVILRRRLSGGKSRSAIRRGTTGQGRRRTASRRSTRCRGQRMSANSSGALVSIGTRFRHSSPERTHTNRRRRVWGGRANRLPVRNDHERVVGPSGTSPVYRASLLHRGSCNCRRAHDRTRTWMISVIKPDAVGIKRWRSQAQSWREPHWKSNQADERHSKISVIGRTVGGKEARVPDFYPGIGGVTRTRQSAENPRSPNSAERRMLLPPPVLEVVERAP